MKTIILIGGKATRLPKSAKDIPKALVKIRGKTILDHQLELLKSHGLNDIRLALGHMADQIIDYLGEPPNGTSLARGGKYEYIVEQKLLGTGGAIKFASRDLKEPFMALNGDILADINLKEFLEHHKRIPEGNFISVYEVEDARDFGLLKLEGNQILKFSEKPKEERTGFINAGFYILHPRVFKEFPQDSFSVETEIFPALARENKLFYYLHKGFWTDLGTETRLAQANSQSLK